METPWNRARKTRHEAQERRLGTMEGGSRQVNSGRLWRWKRDGILHEFLVEARTTEGKGYRITREEFLKIQKDAIQTPPGLLPSMQIDIGDDVSLFVIRLTDFQTIYTRMLDLEARLGEKETGD